MEEFPEQDIDQTQSDESDGSGDMQGTAHWVQTRCEECKAWLPEMPDQAEEWKETIWDRDPECPICSDMDQPEYARAHNCAIRRTVGGWTYIWLCVRCGSERSESVFMSPDRWTPDPQPMYEPRPVGTIDKDLSRDPEEWPLAETFTEPEKLLVRAVAQHVWDIRKKRRKRWTARSLNDALRLQSLHETIEAADRYLSDEAGLPKPGQPGKGSADGLRIAYAALGRPVSERMDPRKQRFLYRLARAEEVCAEAIRYIDDNYSDDWLKPLQIWGQYVRDPMSPKSPKAPFGGEHGRFLTERLRTAEAVCSTCYLHLGAETREMGRDREWIAKELGLWKLARQGLARD